MNTNDNSGRRKHVREKKGIRECWRPIILSADVPNVL